MFDNSWIKFYRKALKSDIMGDFTCWGIFCWLLLKADEEGLMNTGRYIASEELGINPSTFYKAMSRLENKYKMVTQVVTQDGNTSYTNVQIVNWLQYQGSRKSGNTSDIASGNTYTRKNKNNINIHTHKTTVSKTRSCPLETENISYKELQDKYPKGHKECVEYLLAVQEEIGHDFINKPKQFKNIHNILRSKFSFKSMDWAIDKIKADSFFQDKGWDFANVAGFLERKSHGRQI